MLHREKMDIKTEDGIPSVANETSSLDTSDWAASIKVKNEVPDGSGTSESGNSADFFEREKDQTREIKTEAVEVLPTEYPSSEEHESSHISKTRTAEEVELHIKKEEDIDSPEDGGHFKCDNETNQSMTLDDKASGSSVWGLCKEDCSVTAPKVSKNRISESGRSRAHYYSNGFKLAHVSVLLKDFKTHPIAPIVQKRFSCSQCSAKLSTKSTLKIHLRLHTGEKPYSCKYCPAKFKHSAAFANHLAIHTGEKRFLCTYCPTKFSQSSHLKSHLTTHTGEKQFSCIYCPAKFSRNCILKSHLNIHTGEKPYSCKYCPAKFKQSAALQHHQFIHSGEKRFSCAYCSAKFSKNFNLKKHLAVHAQEKQFSCTYCPAKFTRSPSLKRHLTNHSGEKLFSCTYCSAKFSRDCNLKRHLAIHAGEK